MNENIKKYIHDNMDTYTELAKHLHRPPIGRCVVLPYVTNEATMGRTGINQAPPLKGHIVNMTQKEGNDKMSIKIKVDKIKKYKIIGIDALHEDELPKEYTNIGPFFYEYGADGNYLLRYFDNDKKTVVTDDIYIGDEFTESEMRTLIHYVRLAGERLGRINQKIKRDTDKNKKKTQPIGDWSGSYTFEV